MGGYDSDSSAGEDDDFTETNVLLGYASKDAGDDSISRLGGRPEWFDPETPPSSSFAKCNICKDLMVLLLQLNAELPDRFPGHERRLYVFACQKRSCRRRDGSIRTLRSIRVAPGSKAVALNSEEKKKKKQDEEETKPKPKPPSNLGETLFGAKTLGGGSGANPFAMPGSGGASSNPFSSPSNPFNTSTPIPAPVGGNTSDTHVEKETKVYQEVKALPKTFAETLSLDNPQSAIPNQTPPEPWPPESSQPKPYPISYLSEAEYETLDPTPPPIPQATTKMDLDEGSGSGAGGGKEDKEVFESTMDAAFQRFADRLAQNPEQSIRYEFAGTPLLYSKMDAIGKALSPSQPDGVEVTVSPRGGGTKGIPRCPNCGGPRTFEVQLCPHAITELEAEELSLDGMDWGTIIVGVCEQDCQARGVDQGQVGYLEEWTGVQWEEMGSSAPGGGGGGKR